MRPVISALALFLLFSINLETGECILGNICKELQKTAKSHIPKVKNALYKEGEGPCCPKCKQPMTIPLIHNYLEKRFRDICNHVFPELKKLGFKIHKDINPDSLVKLAREFEYCPLVNSKKNLCHFDQKKDQAVIKQLMSKAIEKGMPMATKMISEAGKCDKANPLIQEYMVTKWDTGKGVTPDVRSWLKEAYKMWCV